MSEQRAWVVGDVVESDWADEATVTAWWYTGTERIVELNNTMAKAQGTWEEAGWRLVQKEQAMNERALEALKALEALTVVIGLTPIAGDRQVLQEAYDAARAAIPVLRAELNKQQEEER